MISQLIRAGVLAWLGLISLSTLAAGVEDDRLWLNVNINGPTADPRWRWYAELQPRWRDEGSTLDQSVGRSALYYSFIKHATAAGTWPKSACGLYDHTAVHWKHTGHHAIGVNSLRGFIRVADGEHRRVVA